MKPGIDHIGLSVTFACHDGNGKFLFAKRSTSARDEQGKWSFGGGVVEFGETPEAAVLRELTEEYGCAGTIEETLRPYVLIRPNEKSHWVNFPFIIKVNPAEVSLKDSSKITELGWFALNEKPNPVHSGLDELVATEEVAFAKYS